MKSPAYCGSYIRWLYIKKHLNNSTEHKLCVDIGCGSGEYQELIKSKGYIWSGYDLQPDPKNPEIKFIDVCDMNCIKDESVNVVLFIDVLEHIEDDIKAINEIHRILKKGGILMLHTPNKSQRHLLAEPKEQSDHVRIGYTRQELVKQFYKQFKIQIINTFNDFEALIWDINYCSVNKVPIDLIKALNSLKDYKNYGYLLIGEKK